MKGFIVLLLTRKNQQTINIGGNIVLTILEISGGRIKVGIDAPQEVRVVRQGNLAQDRRQIEAGHVLGEITAEP